MIDQNWIQDMDIAATVCDVEGIILYMNTKAIATFHKYGGKELIGKSLFECHNNLSAGKLRELLTTHHTNCYTIEKDGIRKMIYQTPWFRDGEYSGFVELSIPLPDSVPHFIRP